MALGIAFNHALSPKGHRSSENHSFLEEGREGQTLTEVLLPGSPWVSTEISPKQTLVRAVRGRTGHIHPGAGRKVWEAKQISRH